MGVTTKEELLAGLLAMGVGDTKTGIIGATLQEGRLPTLEKLKKDLKGAVPVKTLDKVQILMTDGLPTPEVYNSAILHDVDKEFAKIRKTIADLEKAMLGYKANAKNLQILLDNYRNEKAPKPISSRVRRRRKKVAKQPEIAQA
jgi:hypothetical protein